MTAIIKLYAEKNGGVLLSCRWNKDGNVLCYSFAQQVQRALEYDSKKLNIVIRKDRFF